MVSKSGAVWAIDIGNNSLKALHLRAVGDVVEVIGFDNIQHGKILTGSGVKDAERDELIALSLRQFVNNNNLGKDDIVVSVPSQNSFARFVKLPPVEPKRIPEIVNFEAAQQIPFDINDVQWDWQMMSEANSAEVKVGIFAIKSDVVTSVLEYFSGENIRVGCVQMAPMALYNYVLYDRPELGKSNNQATVVLNIGAENTDLVICTASTVWQRCILMGGNAFTRAIADTFKLNFEKAEKLKRTAQMSKYARQTFQAMRPVFTDLASEIQRSLGFYTNSNPNTKLSKIIALGGGTKLRGLLKYLQQSLQIPVERPDSFKRLAMNASVSAAKFHENVCDLGIVYGLALQGLGLAKIESNLLPRRIARSMTWASKAKYFTVAACMVLLVSLMSLARTYVDGLNYAGNERVRQSINRSAEAAGQVRDKLETQKNKGHAYEALIQKEFELFEYRNVIPLLHQTIILALPNEKNNAEQKELYKAFANGDAETVLSIPRKERKQVFVTSMSVRFEDDVTTASFDKSGFVVSSGDSGRRRRERKAADLSAIEAYYKAMEAGRKGTKYSPRTALKRSTEADTAKTEEGQEKAGFVVTVTGYSPYKNVAELMDPPGAEDDPNKWGFVTRLLHLDEVVEGDSLFELYEKTKIEHFKLDIGEVDVAGGGPAGVGVEDYRDEGTGRGTGNEEVFLVDPMTKEIISKVAELDEDGREKVDRAGNVIYKVNDHWFVLNAKFVWKDAPRRVENIDS